MKLTTSLILLCSTLIAAIPAPTATPAPAAVAIAISTPTSFPDLYPHIPHDLKRLAKRQDYSALLALASEAGISIPTGNPALLLSLGPFAAKIASYLPTAPVLSQLLTAAPSGFLSQIVHDPSYARSFEDDFAAGSSPSWFLDLPSSVRDYLHTYGGYEGVASQVISAESVIIKASAEGQNGLGQIGGNRTVTAKTTDTGDGESSTTTQRGLSAGILTDSSTSAASSTVASSSSQAGAANAKESGVFAVGAMAMAGILGVAVAL